MFNSAVLEVAIGLVFCFASVSLMVSAINEAIVSLIGLRAKTLLTGIKSLLNDQNFNGLALSLYNHALVNPRSDGTATDAKTLTNKPSYIDAKSFAVAFLDSVQTIPGNFVQLGDDINAIRDPQLKKMMQGIYGRAAGNIDNIHTELAAWFDNGMDRVSGAYKRQSQLICMVIGFVIAVLFNIDAFQLFSTLWMHPGYVAQLGSPAAGQFANAVQGLQSLPIGWVAFPPVCNFHLVVQGMGWLVTASSVLFGSPFWFDLLGRLFQLRGTGGKPK